MLKSINPHSPATVRDSRRVGVRGARGPTGVTAGWTVAPGWNAGRSLPKRRVMRARNGGLPSLGDDLEFRGFASQGGGAVVVREGHVDDARLAGRTIGEVPRKAK